MMSEPANDPYIIPIFPLSGVLLLPDARLPLHIFEPRYRNMVRDAIDGPKLIGMIQPRDANRDPSPLFDIGCTGEIVHHQRLGGGRFVILLRGLQRFRAVEEMDPLNGYRRLNVHYDDLERDDPEVVAGESERVLASLEELMVEQKVDVDMDRLRELSSLPLINTLAMALPFSPVEKQALLEAANADERLELLLSLLAMGFDAHAPASHWTN